MWHFSVKGAGHSFSSHRHIAQPGPLSNRKSPSVRLAAYGRNIRGRIANARADLNLHWTQMSKCTLFDIVAHMLIALLCM